jgi:hypothetical protein
MQKKQRKRNRRARVMTLAVKRVQARGRISGGAIRLAIRKIRPGRLVALMESANRVRHVRRAPRG